MMLSLTLRTAALALCALGLTGCLTAEQRAVLEVQEVEKLKTERTREDGLGWFLADVSFTDKNCSESQIGIARFVDGRWENVRTNRGSTKSFGTLLPATPGQLKAGRYFISSVSCKFGNHTDRYNGPHAAFEVRPGEVQNIGRLVLTPKSNGWFSFTGSLRRSVEPIAPEVLEAERAMLPALMKLIVDRPMTVTGPDEMQTKVRF